MLHGKELIDVYEENEEISYWISGYDWAKVISYSDESACVYYVFDAEMGMTVSYICKDGVWTPEGNSIDAMRSLWSTGGNATETIWPYWYHGLF